MIYTDEKITLDVCVLKMNPSEFVALKSIVAEWLNGLDYANTEDPTVRFAAELINKKSHDGS